MRITFFYLFNAIKKVCEKYMLFKQYVLLIGHKFPTNWFVRNFLQPTYKNDTCLLACEKHMLF